MNREERTKFKLGVLFFAFCTPLAVLQILNVAGYQIFNVSQYSSTAPTSTDESSIDEPDDSLSLSLNDSYVECSPGWCSIFSIEITNSGTTPVDVYEEVCLVAGGKTYSEDFGDNLSDTINPGETKIFDANFEFDSDASASELFIGDCSSTTKVASVRVP
jgi:uncharacterized membrane protein